MAKPPLQSALPVYACSCRQEQLYLVLYLNQEHSGTRQNQGEVVPGLNNNTFGLIAVNDYPIYDSLDISRGSIVAHARGHHIQTQHDDNWQWFHSFNIVFTAGSCYPGSTFIVKGKRDQNAKSGEWAIVGGTGKFTLAQGAIYFDVLQKSSTGQIQELHIAVWYTPVEKSTIMTMFREFNPSEVDDAIDNGTEISSGGFGSVYKGTVGNIVVAVKINNYGSRQGKREFNQEIEILKSLQHENLVRLIGACTPRLALVYEFLPNGTLYDRLMEESFSWQERIRVVTSICIALEFLHNARPSPVAHGDLKPENILFDAKYVCKLGDFGISRLLKYKNHTATPGHTTENWKGTRFYMDPDFIRTNRLTPQSDVYALGIIMLQLVTGRGPDTLRTHVEENQSEQLLDPRLDWDDKSKQDAMEMMRLGLKCCHDKRQERPDLATVVRPIVESMKQGASQCSG